MPRLRAAVLHHWFVTRGGGERVAECLAALLPSADIFSLLRSDEGLPPSLIGRRMTTSFLQNIPGATHHHRHMMPLYPEAARSLDLRDYDLVISSDSGPIKAARLRPGTTHICYCHSPMRYLYDGYDSYRTSMRPLTGALFSLAAPRVRRADQAAARQVTHFIANSHYVAARIFGAYGRVAEVVYPPIDLHRARRSQPGDAYLAAGRLVTYKRTELLIQACNRLGRQLRIAGTGPEEKRLRRYAGPTIHFLGQLSTEDLWNEYSHARALLFAADEDFGMVPLEAQSCGRPVIAYGYGGSLETVRGQEDDPDATGVYFAEQTPESLADAILRFESIEERFRPDCIAQHASGFATPIFLQSMHRQILAAEPAAAEILATPEEAMRTIG